MMWRLRFAMTGWLLGCLFLLGAPAPAATWVVDWNGTGDFTTIQDAIDDPGVNPGDVISILDGIYAEALDLDGLADLSLEGVSRDTVSVRPPTTLNWGVGATPTRQAAVRVVNSTGIDFSGIDFDFQDVAGNYVYGVFYWDSTGWIDDCILENAGVAGDSNVYEYGAYLRAPGFTAGARAEITVTGSTFRDLGRVALQTSDFVHGVVNGCTFTRTDNDFGYGIVVSSESTAEILGCELNNFSDAVNGWACAAIRVHNDFTSDVVTPMAKPVDILGNEISSSHFAIAIGAESYGNPGDVDITVTCEDNWIHDSNNLGILVRDQGRSAGSSVTYLGARNRLVDNADYGYYVVTNGDGEIQFESIGEEITDHNSGIGVFDLAPATSLYSMDIHHGRIVRNILGLEVGGSVPATVDAENNWWGCNEGPNDGPGDCEVVTGSADWDPWLTLGLEADPWMIWPGQDADLTADVIWNSDGQAPLGMGSIPDGTLIDFSTNLGMILPPANPPTVSGEAMAVMTDGGGFGWATVQAELDNEIVSTNVRIFTGPQVPTLSPIGFLLLLGGISLVLRRRSR